MSTSTMNTIEAAVDAGERIARLNTVTKREGEHGTPFVMVEAGVAPLSLEPMLSHPVRKRATVALRDAASFIAYATAFADAHSLVFANIADRTITAVLDYHEAKDGPARWGSHRAVLTCQLTEDWKRWTAANKKHLGQVEFAQFIEDNLPNIAAPAGSQILEIVKTLMAKKAVNFTSSVRLDNGETQFVYEETIAGSAGQKGHLEIPHTFTLGLEPFEGAGLYQLEARFRYRIVEGGKLELWFDLVRHEAVLEDAFTRTREEIRKGLDPVKVLAGQAPAIT